MSADNLKERLDQIEGYAKALVQNIRVMDQKRFMLEPLIEDDELNDALKSKFNSRIGVLAFNQVVPILAHDLVRDISRLFLDPDKRAGSLVNLHRKVSDVDIHEELRTRFRHIPDKWGIVDTEIPGLTQKEARQFFEEWREKDRNEYEKSFDEDWKRVDDFVKSLPDNEILEKIKYFRDKQVAHLQMAPLGEEAKPIDVGELNLTYDEIFQVTDSLMQQAFELTRILTGKIYHVEAFSDVHQKQSLDMWRCLAETNS